MNNSTAWTIAAFYFGVVSDVVDPLYAAGVCIVASVLWIWKGN